MRDAITKAALVEAMARAAYQATVAVLDDAQIARALPSTWELTPEWARAADLAGMHAALVALVKASGMDVVALESCAQSLVVRALELSPGTDRHERIACARMLRALAGGDDDA